MTMATPRSRSTARSGESRESRRKRDERIFESLPALGSKEYLRFLRSVRRNDPPAGVLVRAFRRLVPGDAADATLGRLANAANPPGYLARVVLRAREWAPRLGAYTADDLVANTIGEIVVTLPGPQGALAEGAWSLYLEICLGAAYRTLVGRGGSRLGSHASTHAGAEHDLAEGHSADQGIAAAWRARVEPDNLEWLEAFIERTISKIADPDIRAVGFDLFSENPTQVSSSLANDPNTLTGRFGVNRTTIYRWQDAARRVLYDALNRQNERDIDLSFLRFGT
jgi:hypothetical protein